MTTPTEDEARAAEPLASFLDDAYHEWQWTPARNNQTFGEFAAVYLARRQAVSTPSDAARAMLLTELRQAQGDGTDWTEDLFKRAADFIEGQAVSTPEPEWEYGWRSLFANGEEYEWLACSSREEAERQAREYQIEEDRQNHLGGNLTYSVWRRRVTKPGQWEPVPSEGEA